MQLIQSIMPVKERKTLYLPHVKLVRKHRKEKGLGLVYRRERNSEEKIVPKFAPLKTHYIPSLQKCMTGSSKGREE